jgi:hypothetical protein
MRAPGHLAQEGHEVAVTDFRVVACTIWVRLRH